MKYENYSVLMSVYFKEKAVYFDESMNSVFMQTLLTDDFVLVCDGPLTDELDAVIKKYQSKFGDILNVVRLEKNSGLGIALNNGLKYCKNELVARMDSDDVCLPDRCEKQVAVFNSHEDISVCSGPILEFFETTERPFGKRDVPETCDRIYTFSKKRNPFNHPAVMFKKSDVIAAGGYDETYHLFEDYYLWIRMFLKGYRGFNIQEPLVYMRTPSDMYLRRGGKQYAKDMLRFHRWIKSTGWSSTIDYISGAIPHAIVCVLPNRIRKKVYQVIH